MTRLVPLVLLCGCAKLMVGMKFKPRIGIDEQQVAAPDYGDLASWAAHPELDDPSDLLPEGVEAPAAEPVADCFYVHPTTTFSRETWNAPTDDPLAAGMVDHVLAAQATALSAGCRVFAPRYRQAGLHPMLVPSPEGYQAIDLAWDDVEAGFDHYMEHHNNGRPIVIASHSQGTGHALRLVETRFVNTPLRDQLVVAYLVGYQLPRDKIERTLGDVGICQGPAETGCVVAWDSVSETPKPAKLGAPHWYPDGHEPPFGKDAVCVNPISWLPDGGESADSRGALPVDARESMMGFFKGDSQPPLASLPALIPGRTSARCEGSHLVVDAPDDERMQPTQGSFHGYDYPLFWQDIRDNVVARVEAMEPPVASDSIPTNAGPLIIHPVGHGTLYLEWNGQVIWVDPWSKVPMDGKPGADLLLLTDTHPDHLDAAAIGTVRKPETVVVAPQAVADALDGDEPQVILANGQSRTVGDIEVLAVPMYNHTRGPEPGKLFHDKGRGNGYLLTLGGKRVYIAGDTACTDEMKALRDIDLAFVPMNLPYTMPPDEAAACIAAFDPAVLYPFHYRGSDLGVLTEGLKGEPVEVRIREWYAE